jgi:hypothetical protein
MPEKLTLRYDDEFILELASLPSEIAEMLYDFLDRLADDPDAPDLEAQPASRGMWGCQFTSGYCVYWKVERERTTLTTLSTGRPKMISVRKIKPKSVARIQRNATTSS